MKFTEAIKQVAKEWGTFINLKELINLIKFVDMGCLIAVPSILTALIIMHFFSPTHPMDIGIGFLVAVIYAIIQVMWGAFWATIFSRMGEK